jgi:hypothetical protein
VRAHGLHGGKRNTTAGDGAVICNDGDARATRCAPMSVAHDNGDERV